MLPKNGHSVEKKYFLYSIIKIHNVNYYLKHRKNIFCNLTIFELVNEIEDFESLCNKETLVNIYFIVTLVMNICKLLHTWSCVVRIRKLQIYVCQHEVSRQFWIIILRLTCKRNILNYACMDHVCIVKSNTFVLVFLHGAYSTSRNLTKSLFKAPQTCHARQDVSDL